jgi:predicted  nucleic acid-binding Zn-ribbon protein
MPAITKKQMETLVKVQQLERESAKIEAYLAEVPTRISNLEGELEAYISGVEKDKAAVEEFNKQYRAFEADLQLNATKIQKSEEKLRSVKTNKEYQSSLKEIDDIKSVNSRLEDEMLMVLERIDQAEKALKDREQLYTEIVDESKQEKAAIKKDAEDRKNELLELESAHAAVINELDSGLLKVFNQVKAKQVDRMAIAPVLDAVCQGCNMNIPPQIYNELQRCDQLRYCPHCDRIIYWLEQNVGSE